MFEKTIILDGLIAGTWRMDRAKENANVSWQPLRAMKAQEEASIEEAVRRYHAFKVAA